MAAPALIHLMLGTARRGFAEPDQIKERNFLPKSLFLLRVNNFRVRADKSEQNSWDQELDILLIS